MRFVPQLSAFAILAGALVGLSLLTPLSASAQQVGSYVVVLEEADIIAGTAPVEHVSRGMALKVRGSRPGGWLWVTRHANGWIQSKHVVPVQTAMDYLAAEIAQQPRHAPFYNDRATVLFEIGNYADAVRDYSVALRLVPGSVALRANRAVAYFELGQYDRAVEDLNEVVRNLPDEAQSYVDRGWALYHAKQYEAAVADYQQALQLDPNSLQALLNLVWLKATCPQENLRDGEEALKLARQAVELTERKDAFALATLAAAQAELGDYSMAVESQTAAVELSPYTRKKQYKERLAFYVADQPYRLGASTPAAKPATAPTTAKTELSPATDAKLNPVPEANSATSSNSVLVPNQKSGPTLTPAGGAEEQKESEKKELSEEPKADEEKATDGDEDFKAGDDEKPKPAKGAKEDEKTGDEKSGDESDKKESGDEAATAENAPQE